MKNMKWMALGAMLGGLLVTGCYKESDKTWVEYLAFSTVERTSSNALLLQADNGQKLNPLNFQTSASSGQRMIILFDYAEAYPEGSVYDYSINLLDYRLVLTKGVASMTTANADSIGNDAFQAVNAVTYGGGYVNTYFSMLYNGTPHMITLADSVGSGSTVDTLNLLLRQNANGNNAGYVVKNVVSFNLQSYLEAASQAGKDTLMVFLGANTATSADQIFSIAYPTDYFNTSADTGLQSDWLTPLTGIE